MNGLGFAIRWIGGALSIALGLTLFVSGELVAFVAGFVFVGGGLALLSISEGHTHRLYDTGHRYAGGPIEKCRGCKRVFAGDDELLPYEAPQGESPWA